MVKFALALVIALTSGAANACAVLDSAEPKVGSEVAVAPAKVTLKFTGHIYPEKSTLEVVDAGGNKVSLGKALGDSGDNTVIWVKLGQLGAGKYTVRWNAMCDCGSPMPGDFKFTVLP